MDQFSRLEKVIGKEGFEKLRSTNVALIGIGGVGGICFEMLVRSGIENITVIDFDSFEESNLNRQILSLNTNIGSNKAFEAYKRAININKNCNVKYVEDKISDENINDLLNKDFDFVIDACDDVKAKIEIIKYCISNNIQIISCMGTANKINPEKLKITNIWKTEYDPLAKVIRSHLRKEKINYKLPVVSSDETPLKNDGKVLGTLATVPNTAGILLASYVINHVLK